MGSGEGDARDYLRRMDREHRKGMHGGDDKRSAPPGTDDELGPEDDPAEPHEAPTL